MDKQILIAGEIAVNSTAFENLVILCDKYGSRFFATQEEKDSADFIAMKLQEYGLENVIVEPYTHFGMYDGKHSELWSWEREFASLELLEPDHKQLKCLSLANVPSTPEEGVTAEIFVLESGKRSYLLEHRDEIKGKLVLDGTYSPPGAYFGSRDPDNLYRPTIYGYLAEFEAAGMIFIKRHYGDLPPTGAARFGSIGEIPACGISRETSDYILRQLKKGPVIARLKLKNKYKSGAISYNVAADLPGHESDQIILVGGHFDGHDIAPGAMDDAAGACVVLEAARALAKHGTQFKRTIRFCFFASEELGLNGSTGYVLNHKDDLKNIELMINTDASGISAKTGHSFTACGSDDLSSYLDNILNSIGSFDRDWELPKVTQSISAYSDHWPFFMHGIPSAHFHDVPADPIDLQYSHTTGDTVDKVSPKGLKDAAQILALTLMRLADEEEIPIKHEPIEKVVELLEEKEIAENLRKEKRWRREG